MGNVIGGVTNLDGGSTHVMLSPSGSPASCSQQHIIKWRPAMRQAPDQTAATGAVWDASPIRPGGPGKGRDGGTSSNGGFGGSNMRQWSNIYYVPAALALDV
ncbi:hypothetical protein JDV02_010585 [Purpureocillium takamizusanense]|uniref:Uncharacterized protein n=1 Tax=Purpureocillium takamizusanense TaxID=2060973 RepID=A0A9Q8QT87_9HYPO|nr:uncharacterized protein JDV02_010585 [Purpureocillium takamizusanense]UNI24866.1 hypothetical protein JDV02_010585 [Purpureocillium takamizusanense]